MVKHAALLVMVAACTSSDDAEHVLRMSVNPPSGGAVSVPRGQLLVELTYDHGGAAGTSTESLRIPAAPTNISLPTDFTISFDKAPEGGSTDNMEMKVDILNTDANCVLACGKNSSIYFGNATDGLLVTAPCPQPLTSGATKCP